MYMNISRTIPIFLIGAVLVFGTTISMGIPASFAQPEYKGYEESYGKDYDKKKASSLNLQKVKCNNIILNGLDSSGQGAGGDMLGGMTDENDGTWQEDGQWLGNGDEKKFKDIDKNIVNFCKNKNIEVVEAVEEQNGLNVGSLYTVEGPLVTSQGGSDPVTESIASCDAGDFVISGGFNILPGIAQFPDYDFIRSLPTSTLDGWSASFNTDETVTQIQATAVCFDAQ